MLCQNVILALLLHVSVISGGMIWKIFFIIICWYLCLDACVILKTKNYLVKVYEHELASNSSSCNHRGQEVKQILHMEKRCQTLTQQIGPPVSDGCLQRRDVSAPRAWPASCDHLAEESCPRSVCCAVVTPVPI